MERSEHPERQEHGETSSDALETAQNVSDLFEKDEPVRCSCHGEEKKSQKLSLAAAAFSLGALAISIVSLTLPFLRSADDVTFDAAAWQEFLSTIEERLDDAGTTETETTPDPTPSAALPTPAKPKPVAATTPAPTPMETTPVETAPTETTPEEPTPTEEVAANDTGTPAPAEPVDAGTPADAGTAEEPAAADGSRQ